MIWFKLESINWQDSQVLEEFPSRGTGKRRPGRFLCELENVRQVGQPDDLPCQELAQRT